MQLSYTKISDSTVSGYEITCLVCKILYIYVWSFSSIVCEIHLTITFKIIWWNGFWGIVFGLLVTLKIKIFSSRFQPWAVSEEIIFHKMRSTLSKSTIGTPFWYLQKKNWGDQYVIEQTIILIFDRLKFNFDLIFFLPPYFVCYLSWVEYWNRDEHLYLVNKTLI